MFTRIAKGFLWILMIGVVIGAIAAAVALEDAAWFFIVLLAGAVILMFFGMFVELCNNILDIKQAITKGGISMSNSTSAYTQESPYVNQTYVKNSNYGSMLSRAAKQVETEKRNVASDGWYCRQCGAKNKTHDQFCMQCGKAR